ncbi:phosphotransferase enzyme family protein [Colletotrichum karsti]|uniref:Phosphotransferase enzyme family protein n=1 Tax=Colletotrichum karsti TaxID=1095194 RepID=A0A9P6LI33_9PEZI|nr:phosphotransferase enzyme family protein [Colletotrichum karsti]KAF9873182.1 phosphotransferase enzyme family protein [Colletotrichum karsti]
MNHEKFQERLDLPTDISPVEYQEDVPFPYNNFIYKITLKKPAYVDSFSDAGPYTTPPPAEGVSTIVLRLANPKAQDIIQDNRVENEVAAMYLARQGLLAFKPEVAGLIPAVYAWKSHQGAKGSYSWTLMEYKEGVPLDTKFPGLSEEDQKDVLGQIADVFTGIQQAPLPESIKSHGGLTIDDGGNIVGGKMTILEGAPWTSYSDFWRTRLAFRLKDADESPALEGWKPNGVRGRIDSFLSSGLETYLANSGVDATNNIQYDPESKKITGVLDFDWAYISHPCHEFFTSLGDVGGSTGGGTARDPDLSGGRLAKAILTGNFDIPDLPEEAARQLTRAKAWDDALAARGALRPSAISGITALDRLSKLEALLGPFILTHPVMLKRRTAEQIADTRRATEKQLVECLEIFDY